MSDLPSRSGLRSFFMGGQRMDIRKKQIITQVGASDEAIYWITKGFVKACSYLSDGAEICIHIYGNDEVFPVMKILGKPFHSLTGPIDMVAFTECIVYRRNRQELLAYIDSHPRDALLFLEQQTQVYSPMISLHLTTAEQKVVCHLLYLANRFGEAEGGFVRIALPFTQQEFADSVNVSRETTGKIIGRLEDEGFLTRGRRYTLVNMQRMSRLQQKIS